MTDQPILQTERLALRKLSETDLPFMSKVLCNPRVMAWWPSPFDTSQVHAWFERQRRRYDEHGCGYWLAVNHRTDEPVGFAGVMMVDLDGVEEAGLGWIMDERVWRQGYATEAARGCINWTFAHLDTSRVIALIQPGNAASEQVARKLGMSVERTIVFAELDHAVWRSSLHYPVRSAE